MTQRRIANTDIKVTPFVYNWWEKEIKKKNQFLDWRKEFDY